MAKASNDQDMPGGRGMLKLGRFRFGCFSFLGVSLFWVVSFRSFRLFCVLVHGQYSVRKDNKCNENSKSPER